MFVARFADLNIAIENKYNYVKDMCYQYIIEDKPDFSVSVSDFEIVAEDNEKRFDLAYLESLAIYRKIAEKVIAYDGLLMHGVVIELYQCGIAFLAKSGVGKTTHAKLWRTLLGDRVSIINGDKPLIRVKNDKVFAYGTPWAGKEKIHSNRKTNLQKICFLERAEENQCVLLDNSKVFAKLMSQIYIPKDAGKFLTTVDLVKMLIEKTEFYLIKCNTDLSAAKTAYERLML